MERTIHVFINSARFWVKHNEMRRKEETERKIIKLKEMEILPSRWRWTGKRGAGRMKPLPRSACTEKCTPSWACYCVSHPRGLAQLFSMTWSPSPLLSSQQLHLPCEACPTVTSSKKPSLIPWSRDFLPPLCIHSPCADLNLLKLYCNCLWGVYLPHYTLSSSRVETLLFVFGFYSRPVSTVGRTSWHRVQ